MDCYDVMMYGGLSNGIYTIVPRDGGAPINVSCENDSINEGWLVSYRLVQQWRRKVPKSVCVWGGGE